MVESTNVQTIDVNLDELLGAPGADAVMIPGETQPEPTVNKRNVFSNLSPDTTFLDKSPVKTVIVEKKSPEEIKAEEKLAEEAETLRLATIDEANKNKSPEEIKAAEEVAAAIAAEDVLAPGVLPVLSEEELAEVEKNKGGRPTALVSAAKNMIEKGMLTPFVNNKGETESVDNYTAEDFQELFEANMNSQKEKLTADVPEQFFNQLPPEMQQAYNYLANGGTDMKGMFQALAASNEIRDIDVTTEVGQKYAIRAYLQATNYGTPEEIEDEIFSLEDRGDLEKKATQFKPKLDAMQQSIVQKRVTDQEISNKQRQDQSQKYIESVFSTLETGKLNELKIDNKTQNMLYAGLVQSNYPSISGKQTNMLGHLLEKYQWVEPNHGLIAEALWLLADPEGYRSNLSANSKKEAATETLRTLKTEQSTKSAGNASEIEHTSGTVIKRTGVSRSKKNFFERN